MVQQSQQAREREQQLNQQLTETSEQVCIVHELVIVLLMVVTGIEPATDQREGTDSARPTAKDRGVTATGPTAQTAGQ